MTDNEIIDGLKKLVKRQKDAINHQSETIKILEKALIDKTVEIERLEKGQLREAMTMWEECGNGQGWFAFKVNEDVFMLPYFTVKAYKAAQSYLSVAEIYEVAKPLEKWVKRCK